MKSKGLKLPSLSVLVATYNRADYLRICLECLRAQDYEGDWQIIIADDGSTDHTREVISEARLKKGVPKIQQCWRKHQLYRRAFILNEASRMASGDILLFLDSDCIPALNLLSTYASCAEPDSYYLGGVYYLSQQFSEVVLQNHRSFSLQEFWAGATQLRNQKKATGMRNFKRYWKSKLHTVLKFRKPKIFGGNCAVNRDVFEKINGYDENYTRFSKSDSDLRDRLVKASYRAVPLQTKARTYHLWHPKSQWRIDMRAHHLNDHPYYKCPNPEVICKNGLRKL